MIPRRVFVSVLFSLTLLLSWGSSNSWAQAPFFPSQPPAKKNSSSGMQASPKKWEYLVEDYNALEAAEITLKINSLAGDGWEYLATLGKAKVLFRRPPSKTTAKVPSVKQVPKVEGTWVVISAIAQDQKIDKMNGVVFRFENSQLTIVPIMKDQEIQRLSYKVSTKTFPMEIDLQGANTLRGIFVVSDNKLNLAYYSPSEKGRPNSIADTKATVLIMERQKEASPPPGTKEPSNSNSKANKQ